MRPPSPSSGVEMKYWDCRCGFCSLPSFPRHSLTLTLVCQSKWWTANTERTKTRSAEPVCFSRFGGEGGWVTPWRMETQCFTEVMFCSLFSGKITWRKRQSSCAGAADNHIYYQTTVLLFSIMLYSVLFYTILLFSNNKDLLDICNLKNHKMYNLFSSILACGFNSILFYSILAWCILFYLFLSVCLSLFLSRICKGMNHTNSVWRRGS